MSLPSETTDSSRGGPRPGSGAPPLSLIELIHRKTFRHDRHLDLLERDDSLFAAARRHPGATRILALAYLQSEYLAAVDRRRLGEMFARLARLDRGWEDVFEMVDRVLGDIEYTEW